MTIPFTDELRGIIEANAAGGHRPLLFANARVITDDPLIGDFDRADVLLGGAFIVGIGPGLLTAADDDGAIVIDCDGMAIVPAVVDIVRLQGLRPTCHRGANALSPGNAATFAVVPSDTEELGEEVQQRFVRTPHAALAVIADGDVRVWNSRATLPAADDTAAEPNAGSRSIPAERLGTWIDENDFVHQHLTADGRYDETRGGRPHAYQGSFWISGDRIDYLDDLGFWAYGEFEGSVLHHAGYTFHRS